MHELRSSVPSGRVRYASGGYVLALTAFIGVVCSASLVLAQSGADAAQVVSSAPSEEYRLLVTAAIQEYDERNFDEALALFERAYTLRPSSRVLRGIGKVRFEQRQYTRALDAFDSALAATVDPLTDSMRAEVSELRQRAAAYVGGLTIVVSPTTAVVTLDGRELGADTHYPIHLDIGAHVVSASAEGHQRASRTVDIVGGRDVTVTLDLVTQRAGVVVVRTERDMTGVWVTGSIGIGLVGVTLGSAIWMSDRLDASARCSDAEAQGVTCATASSIASERDAAIGTLLTSAVLTAAAAVTFIVLLASGSDDDFDPNVRVACAPQTDGAGCALWGRW
jgi:hypothetical protein